jgi:hypothetical protein
MTSLTIGIGGRRYPVVLPRWGDSRLHLAAVTISIHLLGQVALGFRVSVPQILMAIVTCAAIEAAVTLRRSGQLVWPASAMLTGSGVALILRVVGTERGDHWTWRGWHVFALVAAGSLLTKYLVTFRGTHVFNPSNLGLVVAFLVLGSRRVEPLDFWWGPLDTWMVLAYLIIVAGGFAITARLGLLAMGITFWLTFTAGLGVLAASGHCMTTAWAAQPVCGSSFWWTVVTSPEVAIFLFFMITDPRTIPAGRSARLVFAAAVAVVATLLIAPQSTEFGAKVGLLAGLTLMSPLRYVLDRLGSEGVVTGLARRAGAPLPPPGLVARGAAVGAVVVALATAVVVAGGPARSPLGRGPVAGIIDVEVDPATLPVPTAEGDVADVIGDVEPGALALVLAENLAVEAQAMAEADQSMLLSVDTGARLAEMEGAVDRAASDGVRVVTEYGFDRLHLRLMTPDGTQAGAALAFDAVGTGVTITYDSTRAELSRRSDPVEVTFVLRQGSSGRWLIADLVATG